MIGQWPETHHNYSVQMYLQGFVTVHRQRPKSSATLEPTS